MALDRKAIWKRDEHRCHICQCRVPYSDMTLDHLIPKAEGGPDEPWNVAASHAKCNNMRGNARFETHASRVARAYAAARYPLAYYDNHPYGHER
ncbi:MAG: HNH endonuclease [Caulobacteraceae bacterium]|nr:HNH endonuclease [Caulobacteraceae bacterium]